MSMDSNTATVLLAAIITIGILIAKWLDTRKS